MARPIARTPPAGVALESDAFNPPPRKRGPGNPEGSPWRNTPESRRGTKGANIRMPPETRGELDRIAARDGLTLGGLVALALAAYEDQKKNRHGTPK